LIKGRLLAQSAFITAQCADATASKFCSLLGGHFYDTENPLTILKHCPVSMVATCGLSSQWNNPLPIRQLILYLERRSALAFEF